MQINSTRNMLRCLAGLNEDRILFEDKNGNHNTAEVLLRINQISSLLPQAPSQDHQILITVANGCQLLACVIAVWLKGYNAVTVSDVAAGNYFSPLAEYLITDHSLAPSVLKNRKTIRICDIQKVTPDNKNLSENLKRTRSKILEMDPLKCRITQLTSGSTGTPKIIVRNMQLLELEAAAIYETIKPDDRENLLNAGTVPYYHSYGLLFRLLFPLYAGITVWADMITYQEELNTLKDMNRKLIFVANPGFLKRMDDSKCPCKVSLVLSAGGVLPVHVLKHTLDSLLCPMLEILGSTETGVMAYRFNKTGNECWNTFPDSKIIPVKEDENSDEILCFTSKHCDQFNAELSDGTMVYQTGDIIEMNGKTQFLLHGRKTRTVKIEDNRISLDAVEKALNDCQLIQEAAVVAMESFNREYTAAMAVLSSEGTVIRNSMTSGRFFMHIRNLLNGTMPAVAIPRSFIFVERLPLSPTGKIDYVRIVQEFKHEIPGV